MSKKNGNGKMVQFPVKSAAEPQVKKSEGATRGEFVVAAEKQTAIRELDNTAGTLQRQLGALEMEYQARKGELFQRIAQNRSAYEQTVSGIARQEGVDLESGKEKWMFDQAAMTFRRTDPPPQAAQAPAPAPQQPQA